MRTFAWIAVLGLVLGGAVWAMAQQQAQMGGWGGMMGGGMMGQGGMMGTNPSSPQRNVGPVSNYSNLCASCHGPTGKGNGSAAAALNPRPNDFTDCKAMTKISDDTLFKSIKGGGQSVGLSPMMPPWDGSLTNQQIHDLVSYVRGFCKK